MPKHLRALAALACWFLAAPLAAGQAAADPADREFARAFLAGFVEASEIDARCGLLDPDRKAKFAENIAYLREDVVREFDAALVAQAEDVGKRYARDPKYLDCGQGAMDRVEDRYERISVLVMIDKRKRAAQPAGEIAAEADPAPEDVQEVDAPDHADEPTVAGPSEAELKEASLGMLAQSVQFARTEKRCNFLDEAMHARVLALEERLAQSWRSKIADPAAVAAVESSPDLESGCGDDLSRRSHLAAEQIETTEALVEAMEMIEAMMVDAKRSQEAAAAADLSVPLPPPPADRPRPLTKAQKMKAMDLDSYARSLRIQRIERRCQYLPAEARARLLRVNARYSELMRLEIGDPVAVAKIDAQPDVADDCGEAQRAEVARELEFLGLTERLIKTIESNRAAASR